MSRSAAPGGTRRRLAHLTTADISLPYLLGPELRADVEAGFEVFGISAPGPHAERLAELGVTHVPVPELTRSWNPRRDLAAFGALYQVVKGLDLDVLHTHNPKTGVMGRVVGRAARVPIVVNTCHGLWATPEDPAPRRAAVYAAEGISAWFGDAQLYQNGQDHETLARWVPRRRSSVVGNGVDLERFRRDPSAGAGFRAELGVGPDELLVGGVGRMVAEKGIETFAAVARALEGKATFVWVGPPDEDKADHIASEVPGVRLTGMRTDMVAVYSALDLFVLPSHREGFCRSGMEAAACGCAIVLSDIRGCHEVGRDGIELALVAPQRPELWIDAVGGLLADPDRRRRLAAAAELRARRTFDQSAVAAASLAAYDRVALRKGLVWDPVAPEPRYLDPTGGSGG